MLSTVSVRGVGDSMKQYAIAYVNFFDNDLQLKLVEADDWKEALVKGFGADKIGWLESKNLESAKEEAFNSDCLIDVKEIEP